jgi:hypothetical protein
MQRDITPISSHSPNLSLAPHEHQPKKRFPSNCARRLALVPGLAAAFAVFSVNGAEFHVAPAPAGDDTNTGLAAKPFASLEKARDAARAANDSAGSTIVLAPGIHRRAITFELDARDAGLRFSGDGARISGAVAIPNDAVKPVSDPAILARLLPEVRGIRQEASRLIIRGGLTPIHPRDKILSQ